MDKKDVLKAMYGSGREAEMYRKIDRLRDHRQIA